MTRRTFFGSFGAITSTVVWPAQAAGNRQQFSASGSSSTQPDAGCAPGFIVAFGTLTADTTGDSFAVGDGVAILPRPDTMAVKRLEQFIGAGVELIIRPRVR